MTKRALYVAYHYPPVQVSSGVHRTLAFSRCMSDAGWKVTVLSTALKAYQAWAEENYRFIPEEVEVIRAFGRDTARHFTIFGRYLQFMALPDRWQSWIFGGVWAGLRQIRRSRPDVIISTYPIASAHIIGYLLHKLTGVPWVADFRDPMLQDDYPQGKALRRVFGWIEKKAVRHCSQIIFTSPGAIDLYKHKFPQAQEGLWSLIPNGFDEAIFSELEPAMLSEPPTPPGKVTLLHSGTVYPGERDPTALFDALAELKTEQPEFISRIHLLLRATGHDALFTKMLKDKNISELVTLAPSLDYLSALKEMLGAQALLLLQSSGCNYQTPAKAYEYLKAKRPVLALTDAQGDTAKLVEQSNMGMIAPLDDKEEIKQALMAFIERVQRRDFNYLSDEQILSYSRGEQARKLIRLLDNVIQ